MGAFYSVTEFGYNGRRAAVTHKLCVEALQVAYKYCKRQQSKVWQCVLACSRDMIVH